MPHVSNSSDRARRWPGARCVRPCHTATWVKPGILTGKGTLHPTEPNRYVARFTSTGTHLWSRTLDPDLHSLGLAGTADGGTLLAGAATNPVTINGQQYLPPGGGTELFFLRFAP